jgi:hypothetical protein
MSDTIVSSNRPLILVDSSCVVHKLINLLPQGENKQVFKLTNKKRDEVIKAGVAYYETGFPFANLNRDNCDILFSGDDKSKAYWRMGYMKKWLKALTKEEHANLPKDISRGYKGSRINDPYKKWCQKRFYKFSNSILFPGYESDDIIAAIVKVVDGKRPIIIMTVDSDLSGLVSDTTIWSCLTGFSPPVRDKERLQQWLAGKFSKETINNKDRLRDNNINLEEPTTSDLWKYKILCGDRSDNLPPNTPSEMIDLWNPPLDRRLWENYEFLSKWENHIKPVNPDEDGEVEDFWLENYYKIRLTQPVFLPEAFTGN